MKKLLILLFIAAGAKAQTTTPDSAKYFEGSLKTVCGTVASIFTSDKGNTFIDFGEPLHLSDFTAVIFAKDTGNFKEYNPAEFLKEKKICVIGKIKIYEGKPEIIINRPDQIRFPDSKE
jgi:hypothetical protein